MQGSAMFENEKLISLSEASRLIPGKPHPSSIWRACRLGLRARNGKRIRLEHLRCFGRILTSQEAVGRFCVELTRNDAEHFDESADAKSITPQPSRRTATARERDIEKARIRVAGKGM